MPPPACGLCQELFSPQPERTPYFLACCGTSYCRVCIVRHARSRAGPAGWECPHCRRGAPGVVNEEVVRAGPDGPELLPMFTPNRSLMDVVAPQMDTSLELDAGLLRLGRRIASGSFGTVREGTYDGKDIAAKVFDQGPVLDRESIPANLRREVEILGRVATRCDNVCRMYGWCINGEGRLCIVMKRYQCNLHQIIADHGGAVPLAEAVPLLCRIGRGLLELHRQDIIMRDLKPANVLIDDHGDAVVADFGISVTAVASTLGPAYRPTNNNGMVGTPEYMPPEQWDHTLFGGRITPQADVWSFAALAVEMLGGKLYPGLNLMQMMTSVVMRKEGPAVPAEVLGGEGSALHRLIVACFSFAPQDRPDLRAVLDGLRAHGGRAAPLPAPRPPSAAAAPPPPNPAAGPAEAALASMAAMPDNAHVQAHEASRLHAWIYAAGAGDGARRKRHLGECGGVEAVVAALVRHPDDTEVQSQACNCLDSLVLQDDENQRRARECGGVEAVVAALVRHPDDTEVQSKACEALGHLGLGDDENKRRAGECGGVEAVVAALVRHPDDTNVQSKACRALGSLGFQNDENRRRAGECGGVEAVVAALVRHPAKDRSMTALLEYLQSVV